MQYTSAFATIPKKMSMQAVSNSPQQDKMPLFIAGNTGAELKALLLFTTDF
jgi:hypothetical protein